MSAAEQLGAVDEEGAVSEEPTVAYLGILVPVHLMAVGGLWFHSAQSVVAWIVTHLVVMTVGGSLANHRLFAHRSYTPRPWLRDVLGVFAAITFQGGPIFWAASHRFHHAFTERPGDPHSAARGLLFSHIGWTLYRRPNGYDHGRCAELVPDVAAVPSLRLLERLHPALNYGLLLVALLVFFAAHRLDLFFWMFPIRIVSGWHATWLANSWVHGARLRPVAAPRGPEPFIRDSLLLALLIPGEGPHRLHHLRPSRLAHPGWWRAIDPGYWALVVLARLGQVELRRPRPTD